MKKRLLAAILCMIMVLSLVVPAFAATVPDSCGKSVGYSEADAKLISTAFKAAYQKALDAGYNPGTPDGLAHDWDGVICQNFKDGDSTGSPWGISKFTLIAMKSPSDASAFLVKNEFVTGFEPAGATSACGAPLANNDGKVQPFEKGALVLVDGAAKWIAVPEGTGVTVGKFTAAEKASIRASFTSAYAEALAAGFNPGTPNGGDKAHDWDGVVAQNFSNGDSTGSPWGIPNFTMIAAKDPADAKAFLVKNAFITGFEAAGAPAACGGPLENDNGTAQAFENGAFAVVDGLAVWTAKPVSAEPAPVAPAPEATVPAVTASPKTADAGMLGFLLTMGAGMTGLVLARRKKAN